MRRGWAHSLVSTLALLNGYRGILPFIAQLKWLLCCTIDIFLLKYISSSSTERSRTYSKVPNKTLKSLSFFGSSSPIHFFTYYRAVGRSKNWPSLILIGLTDLPKSGGAAMAPPGTTPLAIKQNNLSYISFFHLTNLKKVPPYNFLF